MIGVWFNAYLIALLIAGSTGEYFSCLQIPKISSRISKNKLSFSFIFSSSILINLLYKAYPYWLIYPFKEGAICKNVFPTSIASSFLPLFFNNLIKSFASNSLKEAASSLNLLKYLSILFNSFSFIKFTSCIIISFIYHE